MDEAARRISQAQEEEESFEEHEPARKRYRSQSGVSEEADVAHGSPSHTSSNSPPVGSYSLPELAAVASALAPYDIPESRSSGTSAETSSRVQHQHHHHHHHHHRSQLSPFTDDLSIFRQGLSESIARGKSEIDRLSAFVERGEALLAKLEAGGEREDDREARLRELLASIPVQDAIPLPRKKEGTEGTSLGPEGERTGAAEDVENP
jgi:hypothetical protein